MITVSSPRPGTRIEAEPTPDSTATKFRCSVTGEVANAPIYPGIPTLYYDESGEYTGWDWEGPNNLEDDEDTQEEVLNAGDTCWQDNHG